MQVMSADRVPKAESSPERHERNDVHKTCSATEGMWPITKAELFSQAKMCNTPLLARVYTEFEKQSLATITNHSSCDVGTLKTISAHARCRITYAVRTERSYACTHSVPLEVVAAMWTLLSRTTGTWKSVDSMSTRTIREPP